VLGGNVAETSEASKAEEVAAPAATSEAPKAAAEETPAAPAYETGPVTEAAEAKKPEEKEKKSVRCDIALSLMVPWLT
jgi:hypothetical protein